MQKRDLARLEELAARARKAESAGFHISRSSSPQPPSSARSGSHRSQLAAPPHSAGARRSTQRSPSPSAPVNTECYDEHGTTVRVYRGNGTISADPRHPVNGGAGDPFSDRQSVSTTNTLSTNIIPIQYIPPSQSDDNLARAGHQTPVAGVSQAARTLDEARQNLFRPRQTPPQRPARSPDLHLRLSPPNGRESPDLRSPGGVPVDHLRDSYLSANSSTPSFLSGNSYDIHSDAPKIVTSKQVQIGRVHQAEVVQLAGGQSKLSAPHPVQSNQAEGITHRLQPPAALSPISPASGTAGRTLTPTSRNFEDAEEGLVSEEPSATTPTDLRFSMGSLAAYDRNSVSTMGTANYLARPDPRQQQLQPTSPAMSGGARESMLSAKSYGSYADSLGGYPMIFPPPQPGSGSFHPASTLPQSTSVSTLDHHAVVHRPPPSYQPLTTVRPGTASSVATARPGTTPSRPTTANSVTESLGGYPFVPPNPAHIGDDGPLPSAGVPDTAVSKGLTGRNVQGMSTTSEGLGGFDFVGVPPPMPGREGERR